MSFFDKLKKKSDAGAIEDADGLPVMKAEPSTLSDAIQASTYNPKDFRTREKEKAAATAAAENEGLPSVNRRKGGNKMVTVIGFFFILGAAAAMIVAVNGEKKPKAKKSSTEEQVANNLPPIVVPSAPPPIQSAPVTPTIAATMPNNQVPAIKAGASGAAPIPVQGAGQPPGMNGKPPLDWSDRKMGGALLVNAQMNGNTAHNSARPTQLAAADADPATGNNPAVFAGQRGFNGSPSNNELAEKLEPTITKAVAAATLQDRNFLITKGTTLDCALETALDSSVPGITTCRLTRDVYSDNGQVLLLDRGSQLVGEYKSGVKQGQVRLFVLWTRAKTPNGVIVSLNSPGTDALGRSGVEGWVDNHFAERFGAAILMSFIKDAVTAIANRNGGGTTNYYGSAASGGEKVVEKILESTVNIPPTIIKNQGDHIQVMVARDLDFSTVYGLRVKQ